MMMSKFLGFLYLKPKANLAFRLFQFSWPNLCLNMNIFFFFNQKLFFRICRRHNYFSGKEGFAATTSTGN